jgi:hypothetical protein
MYLPIGTSSYQIREVRVADSKVKHVVGGFGGLSRKLNQAS